MASQAALALPAAHTDSVLCAQVLSAKKLLASGGEVRGWGQSTCMRAQRACPAAAAAGAACRLPPTFDVPARPLHPPVQDGAICLTDLATLQPVGRVAQTVGDAVPSLCGLPGDDHTLFAAACAAVLQLDLRRSLDAGAVVQCFGVNADEVNSVAARAANGGWVAAGDDAGEVQVISLQQPPGARGAAAAAAAAGNATAGSAAGGGAGSVTTPAPSRPAAYKTLRRGHTNICAAVAFRPHRPWDLLSGGLDCRAVSWDFSRLRPVRTWDMSGEATAGGGAPG